MDGMKLDIRSAYLGDWFLNIFKLAELSYSEMQSNFSILQGICNIEASFRFQ